MQSTPSSKRFFANLGNPQDGATHDAHINIRQLARLYCVHHFFSHGECGSILFKNNVSKRPWQVPAQRHHPYARDGSFHK